MPSGERAVRSHVVAAAGISAALLSAVLVLLLIPSQPTRPAPKPTPAPMVREQSTMLVQVTLERVRAASILTASGGPRDEAVLLPLQQDLLLADGPVYTPLLDANLSLNRRLTAQAVSNTLGMRVDSSWRMERKALAGFVDSVGGIPITLAEPVTLLDQDGAPVLQLPAGQSRLTGPQASWYAIGVREGEDPIAGIQARFTEVITAAVSRLPTDPGAVSAILTSLGALSDALPSMSDVVEQLLRLRRDLDNGRTRVIELPLRSSVAADPVVTRQQLEGGPAAAVGAFRVVDYAAATPTIRKVFAAAPRIARLDGRPRALVWNATAEPLASRPALGQLFDAGFSPISAGDVQPGQSTSSINGVGYFKNGIAYASAAQKALKLTGATLEGDIGTSSPVPEATQTPAPTMPPPDQRPWADVEIVIGADYQPCPANKPECLEDLRKEIE